MPKNGPTRFNLGPVLNGIIKLKLLYNGVAKNKISSPMKKVFKVFDPNEESLILKDQILSQIRWQSS